MSSTTQIKTKISAEKLNQIKENYLISAPQKEDKTDWFNMWKDYAGDSPPPEIGILEHTWARLLKSDNLFNGLFLYQKEPKKLVGFLHYILHPSTWRKGLSCYVEDSYILKNYRKTGSIIALHDALLEEANEQKWEQIYWMTRPDNTIAQRFYSRIAKRTNWIRYEYNLSDKHEQN